VLVEGVNMVKKHAKPSQQNPQGGILNQEAAIHVSNVMLIDPKSGKPTRVGYKVLDNGTKIRIAIKSGEAID
jgi:large subunit ribosomal protein L24